MNEYIKLDVVVALYCIFHQKYFVCGLLACNSLCPECQLRYQNSGASGVKVCHDIEFLLSFVLRNCPPKSSIQKAVSFPGKTNCRGWRIITAGIPDNGDIKLAWKEKLGGLVQNFHSHYRQTFWVTISSKKPPSKRTIQQVVCFLAKTDCWGWQIFSPGFADTGGIKLVLEEKWGRLSENFLLL